MAMLEKRFYPRQEIAEIVGIANLHDKHFAEKVKRYLDNRGYGYDYSRNGVTISRTPQTAEEKLAFLLVEDVGLDTQINAYDFACFITAFSVISSFDSVVNAIDSHLFAIISQEVVEVVVIDNCPRADTLDVILVAILAPLPQIISLQSALFMNSVAYVM